MMSPTWSPWSSGGSAHGSIKVMAVRSRAGRQSPGSLLGQVAAGDLDGDGIDEVLSLPARRADGTFYRTDVTVPAYPVIEEGVSYTSQIGDLDADGRADTVGVSSREGWKLWVSDANGLRRGFPVVVPGGNAVVSAIRPLIGDVDGDGTPNIVLGSANYYTNRDQVQIFDNRGRLLRTLQSSSYGVDSAVLADMDADGVPEIAKVGDSTIEVWRGDGTPLPGWPRTMAENQYLKLRRPSATSTAMVRWISSRSGFSTTPSSTGD